MPELPPPDPAARLAELRRQRAAVAGHLAWLDREIAAAAAPAAETPSAALPPHAAPAAVPLPPPPGVVARAPSRAPFSPDTLFKQESSGLTLRDKLGCIGIVVAIALLILSFFWVLPYLVHRDRPPPEMEQAAPPPSPPPPAPPSVPGASTVSGAP